MEFNLRREQKFAQALKPKEIKGSTKRWTTIEGYIYVISKIMPIKDGQPAKSLFKVGMSSINTKEGFEKGYTRLLGLRTALINFKVHRIYLFEASPFDEGVKEPIGKNALAPHANRHEV